MSRQSTRPGLTPMILTAAGVGAYVAGRLWMRQRRRFSLDGRTVFITGGSRGLGLVLARQFAQKGANVAICARDADELDRARQDLEARGAAVLAVPCDVSVEQEVNAAIRQVVERFGGIDVLVNNAGTISVGPMEVMTLGDYKQAMATHFWGPLFTTLGVLPLMRASGQGRIVNICSIGGKIAVPHLLPYSASKFALVGFSEGLRSELLSEGIFVTTVCPGLMRTGSPRNAIFKGRNEAEYAWFSISDSLPLASMDAERAARRIVQACRYGEAEVILSLPAKLAVTFHNLLPGLTSDLNALVGSALPSAGADGHAGMKGRDSASKWSPSMLTRLSDRAARANNEMGE